MKEDYKIYKAKPGDKIANECNEKWIKLDQKDSAYKKAEKSIKEIDELYRVELMSVVSVDDGDCYLALYSGGLNGGSINGVDNKWCAYLNQIKKMLKCYKHSWIVDITNDCCDDVWYLTIGFEL